MYLIGITGGTGCGKSTIVNNIIKEISEKDICYLSQDSYYKDNSSLTSSELKFDNISVKNLELKPICISSPL